MGNRTNRTNRPKGLTRRRLLIERLGQRRVLAAITGTVFDDANYSFQFEEDESGAFERLVYVDTNGNEQLDVDESYSLTQSDGSFSLPALADGTYLVRLYNGTDSQIQTFPIEATVDGETVDVTDAIQLEVVGDTALALTQDSLVIGNLTSGFGQSLAIGDQLTKMQPLPNGNLLVIGSDPSGDTAWVVDLDSETVTPVDLAGSDPAIVWSDVAIDANGGGVLLAQTDGVVYSVDATSSPVVATATSEVVAAGSQLLTSSTGVLTVIAAPTDGGMELRLWSNQTQSYLQGPVSVAGIIDLLAYDDAAGVLAARNDSGGVNVYDTANNFQPLHSIDNIDGPIAIDGLRDLLMAISPGEAALKIINLRDGELIADLAVDLSSIGEVAAMAIADRDDAVVVLGAAGVTEVALNKPAGQEVVISGGQDPDPVLFGIALNGTNGAPIYLTSPVLSAIEDTLLELAAPAALENALDLNGDQFVVLQTGQPANGTATIGIDGSVSYEPDADFFGTDFVSVRLTDGRDISANIALEITVAGTPDSPTGIDIELFPVPENLTIGTPVGTIEVIDVDGVIHTIEFDDPRFGEENGEIIFVGGGDGIDYELEPLIPLTISVTDPETEITIEENVILTVQDQNDPVTGITPNFGFVDENVPGDIVIELEVQDQDAEQAHFITVDDSRFVVEDRVLRLAPGVEVDFETEPTIVINITATELPGGGTYTEQFTVTVRDEPEQPQGIDLTKKSVLELDPGAVVGDVTLDGQPPASNYELTVDDPRFEINGTTLKLKDDQFVSLLDQAEIQVEITAEDIDGQVSTLSETFVIVVLTNQLPYHNEENPYDVDNSGEASALDALIIINYMGEYGPGPVGNGDPAMGYDVNGDGNVTALDALLIINQLNNINTGIVGGSEGEGEQAPSGNGRPLAQQSSESNDRPNSDSSDLRNETESVIPLSDAALKLVDVSLIDRSSLSTDAIEVPTEHSVEDFAENVDLTLRLLSDEDL